MTRVAAAADGRVVGGSRQAVNVWRDAACEHTIQDQYVRAVAVLPDGARFVTVSPIGAKLWTVHGALERTLDVGRIVVCVAALPDGVHFVVGPGFGPKVGEVRLYHVDGTFVHTFKGHTEMVESVSVTPDGHHIISGAADKLIKVWSVATKSLVSTCEGHTQLIMAVAAMPDGQRFLSGGND